MEEQKKVKEVKMGVVKNENKNEQPQKLTYEQLNQACADMSQQLQQQNNYIQQMRQQMQQMNFALQTRRMDYLFKVVETANQFNKLICKYDFDSDFVSNCIAEIQESLTIPEQPEESKENK